jgi:hypothetical protein
MQQFNAIAGQSLIDICLNTYGSLEFLTQLMQDNSVQTINDTVTSGQVFNCNSEVIYSRKFYATNTTNGSSAIHSEGDLFIESEDGQIIISD